MYNLPDVDSARLATRLRNKPPSTHKAGKVQEFGMVTGFKGLIGVKAKLPRHGLSEGGMLH